jgi:hypothetical protein
MNVSIKTLSAGCLLALAVVLQAGCATSRNAAPEAAVPVEGSGEPIRSGKVLETMNSGGYTYMHLENNGQKKWVAVPLSKVEVGQEVKLAPGTEMGQFSSRTLQKTFDSIVFTQLEKDAAPQPPQEGQPAAGQKNVMLPGGHPSMGQQMQPPQGHAPLAAEGTAQPGGQAQEAAKPRFDGTISGKVVETMSSGGYTYVNLEKDGKKTWVAIPAMTVTVGQELEVRNGPPMTNFTSKTLNRTFESVIFSVGPVPGK